MLSTSHAAPAAGSRDARPRRSQPRLDHWRRLSHRIRCGRPTRPTGVLGALLLLLVVVVAACSGGDDRAATTPTTTPVGSVTEGGPGTSTGQTASSAQASASVAPTTTTGLPSTTGPGCGTGPATVPDGAVSAPVVDVDRDGWPDTAWILTAPDGRTRVGVVTAAGGGAEREFVSASPVTRSVLVADVNPETPVVLLADDGRSVQLWAFVECGIAVVTDVRDEPYVFSLGFSDIGTGVGCAVVDGRNELVGLDTGHDDGPTLDWGATVVQVEGTVARNGRIVTGTYRRPADDDAIGALTRVSCGDLTIERDGITAPG